MIENILCRMRMKNLYMNINFIADICNEQLITICIWGFVREEESFCNQMEIANKWRSEIFFLDTLGGTAQTFDWFGRQFTPKTTLFCVARNNSDIVMWWKNRMLKASRMGKVLQKCKHIAWDECPMADKKSKVLIDHYKIWRH